LVLRCRQCGRKTRPLYLALQIAEDMAREAQEEIMAAASSQTAPKWRQ
jgi:hypothetical protein